MAAITKRSKKRAKPEPDSDLYFIGKPIPVDEAMIRWPFRYHNSSKSMKTTVTKGKTAPIKNRSVKEEERHEQQANCHYDQALVDGVIFKLGDDVYVNAEKGEPHYMAKIIEFFQAKDGEPYFRAQWFFRPEDTVISTLSKHVPMKKRVFLSNVEDDNHLKVIYSRVNIAKVPLKIDSGDEDYNIPAECDFYYDMNYHLPDITFSNADDIGVASSAISCDGKSNGTENTPKGEKFLLDLYSGCGAMSTGLCMGSSISGVKLTTKWAVDINGFACESLRRNHPETEVRNEAAKDFYYLIKIWKTLCEKFLLIPSDEPILKEEEEEEEDEDDTDTELPPGEFEVEKFTAICHGDPNGKKENGSLHLRVRWKGYGENEDTWEPYSGLGNCKEKLKEFVTKGFKSNLLPLPGSAYFVCGGPPCQGISGYNRYRNPEAPLKDEKNQQLLVFLDIIEFLKPKYVLMENVVDLLKFSKGYLGRYAVASLVAMNYQTRLGMMVAGSYGIPQIRNRVFLWGAQPNEKLPPYPLPTHKILGKCYTPREFKEIQVGHGHVLELENDLSLHDALSGLPGVSNREHRDERNYHDETITTTDFHKHISIRRSETLMPPIYGGDASPPPRKLFDHQPLELTETDIKRVYCIPKKKGANYTDMPGVRVQNNKAELDPSVDRVMLGNGKFLVPDYALSYCKGKSKKPFGRLAVDEIVTTVVTRAEPHNQRVIHPDQDRVLSVRENARIQGFPDCYKLCGTIKQKYIQVGNAVAVPVGVALGYAFGMASQGLTDDKPVMKLPFKYPECIKKPN